MLLCGDGGDDVRLGSSQQQCLFQYSLLTPAAPERRPTPLGRATVPRPPHTAGLGVPGERRGAVAKLGERGVGES